MPAALDLPVQVWDLVHAEFLKGILPQFLSKKFGINAKTIATRAYRGGWHAEREKIIEAINNKLKRDEVRSATKAHADVFVERVKKQVDVGLDVLDLNAPKIATVERHARVLETLARVGRAAHKLDDETERNVTLSLTLLKQEEPEPIEAEVVSSICPAPEPISPVETTD